MSRPHSEAAEAVLLSVENMSGSANRIILLLMALCHAVLANREATLEVKDAIKAQHQTVEKYSTEARRRMQR